MAEKVVMRRHAVGGALAMRAEERFQSTKSKYDPAALLSDLEVNHANSHRLVAMELRVTADRGSRPPVTPPDFDARDVLDVMVEVARDRFVRLAHRQLRWGC